MTKRRKEESGTRLSRYMKEFDLACVSADMYLPSRNGFDTQTEYELNFKEQLERDKIRICQA